MPGKDTIRESGASMQRDEGLHAVRDVLTTVGHELRAPLGVIKALTSSLRIYGDQMSPAERAETFRMLDDAVDRLGELIDDLLAIRCAQSDGAAPRSHLVDVAALARAVVAEIRALAPRHVLTVEAPDPPPLVLGDERRLRRVLLNLVDNAVKYSPAGGPVRLTVAPHGETVQVSVADRGIGIAPEQREHIFERFYRADNGPVRQIEGTGLGLAIVKDLVDAHGGAVWAESAGVGRGSTFVVVLPALHETDSQPAREDAGDACVSGYGHRSDARLS